METKTENAAGPSAPASGSAEPLHSYLTRNVNNGVIDFRLRARLTPDGDVSFYIHPACVSGETRDYTVTGDIRVGEIIEHVETELKKAKGWQRRNLDDGHAEAAMSWTCKVEQYERWLDALRSVQNTKVSEPKASL